MIYYWLSAVGFFFGLKYSSLLEGFRKYTILKLPFLLKLYNCGMCLGFWIGMSLIPFLYFQESYGYKSFLMPFSTSAICWVADGLINLLHSFNRISDMVEQKVSEFSFLKP
jgi:hypothetical protein